MDRNSVDWNSNRQLAELIEVYERGLRRSGLIDFDDMVLLAMRLLEGLPWVRKMICARFPIIIVDEYQDLGLPLHRIVKSLYLNGGIRIFAVGDPDQSIYGFTGAKPELINELSKLDGIEQVHLRFNYRCGGLIIWASEVALGESRGYEAKRTYTGLIDFHYCAGGIRDQAEKICNNIITNILAKHQGCELGDIAILYLDRNDGDIIAEYVKSAGMKFIRIDGGAPYRKTPMIRWLEDCAIWCSGGWEKGTPQLSDLIKTWLRFNKSLRNENEQHALRVVLVRFLFSHRFPNLLLKEWLSDFYSTCIDEAFKREFTLRDEVNAFDNLLNICRSKGELADFIVASFAGQAGSKDHLNLITLHRAKGLEFEAVIMMGMDQGRIPSWDISSTEARKEARRLFYVGLTRAKKEVHLTFSGFYENRLGRIFKKGPSEFLIEINDAMKSRA